MLLTDFAGESVLLIGDGEGSVCSYRAVCSGVGLGLEFPIILYRNIGSTIY